MFATAIEPERQDTGHDHSLEQPPPAPRRVPAPLAAILALLAYGAIALALFPGVVTHLATAFPGDLGDPPSQAWILAWDLHALTTQPAHLYDANVFYPFHDVLAYQDSLLGLLPLAAPVLWLSGSAVVAYNVLFLLSFALCAWGAYLLARLLTGDDRAAFLAGLVYGFSAYRMVHLYHLNLLSGMWIPFALLCWERVRRGERRYWLGVGLFFVLQALSALYYAAFLSVALALLLALHLWQMRRTARRNGSSGNTLSDRSRRGLPCDRSRRPLDISDRADPPSARALLLGAALTALACGLALWPFFAPYFRVEHALGASRGLGQAVYFAADLRDFLHSVDLSLLYGWSGHALGVRPADALQYLWPGALALSLGIWGVRQMRGARIGPHRAYAILCVAAAVLCLGPFLKLWGIQTGLPLPYLLLYGLPGFAGLRDPARFGAIYTLALAVLAAYGAAALLRRLPRRATLVAVLLCAGVLAESWIRPLPVAAVPVGANVPPVYRWLAARPAGRAVLELPIGLANKAIWAEQAEMMYFSTFHWQPIVNGTGGFAPPGYDRDVPRYNAFPASTALRLLHARHVRYVIVHRDWLGAAAANAMRVRAAHMRGVTFMRHWPGIDLYALR